MSVDLKGSEAARPRFQSSSCLESERTLDLQLHGGHKVAGSLRLLTMPRPVFGRKGQALMASLPCLQAALAVGGATCVRKTSLGSGLQRSHDRVSPSL